MADLPDLDENPVDWRKATAAVRLNVYWFVVAGGIVAAALFGTTLITRPTLTWPDDSARLLIAWAAATIGIGAVVAMLAIVVNLYRPRAVRLDDLPGPIKDDIAARPELFLPPGVDSLEKFVKLLPAQYELAKIRKDDLASAERRLADGTEDQKSDLEAEVTKNKAVYRAASARAAELQAAATALIDRGGYETVRTNKALPWLIGLAVAAGSLGVGFQLLLTAPAKDDAAAPVGGTATKAAVLKRDDTSAANTALWNNLGLAACEARQTGSTGIPILVDSGKGTLDEPYVVHTIPEAANGSACQRISFSTIDSVARVVLPKELTVTVTYTPSPEPTS